MARAIEGDRAWADAIEEAEDEFASLVASTSAPVSKPRNMRRWVAAGMSVGVVGLCCVALKRGTTHCVPATGDTDIITLMQAYRDDIVGLTALAEKPGALTQWLAAASTAGDAADRSVGSASSTELAEEANEAIHKALAGGNANAAEKLAEKLMRKAVERNAEQRQKLAEFAKGLGAKDSAMLQRGLLHRKKTGLNKQVSDATCVFNVLALTTSMAALSANINDVSKTCAEVPAGQLLKAQNSQTHAKVCAVNVAAMIAGFATIAASLAVATNQCAETVVPNVDALCAASITGIITATAGFGGSFTLIAAACKGKGWYDQIPAGLTPSNVGSNQVYRAGHARSLRREESDKDEAAEEDASPSAPARQLLFGGGKGALATQCATQIANIAWGLAALGLSINGMANKDMNPSCPPTNILGGTSFKDPIYHGREELCTVNVASAFVAFFGVITMAQLAFVTCADTMNVGAICGSGVSGSFAAASAITASAAGLALACDKGQFPIIHEIINAVRDIDSKSGVNISGVIGNGFGAASAVGAGRRLETEEQTQPLKAKYKTPAEAWKAGLGYDLEDPSASWRGTPGSYPSPIPDFYLQAIVDEVEGVGGANSPFEDSGLFGQRSCDA